jgi:DNA-directed RNA polymerase subunit RPC12/RpoP
MQRIVAIVFSIPFIGVPIAMISMLWSNDGFGGPPIAMKIVGSLICGAVGFAGLCMMFGSIFGKAVSTHHAAKTSHLTTSNKSEYKCSNCGASIGINSDISPSGDVKCQFCNSWFNVNTSHRT